MTLRGRLWIVVGASGVGKDTLLRWLTEHAPASARVRVVRRVITRDAHPSEDHVALDDAGFDAMLARDALALHWSAHGVRYGVTRAFEAWLAAGDTVVINGSRAHLPVALARYPQARVIEIVANAATVAARLHARRRETAADLDERSARNAALGDPAIAWRADATIVNDGRLDDAGHALLAALTATP